MRIDPKSPRPRINSPLYEDGPWLKDPITPDSFRHRDLGIPVKSQNSGLFLEHPQKSNRGGSNRAPEPSTSITSVHKAGKKR